MVLAALIFSIGAAMMTASTSSLGLLYAGRTIGGVGVGMVSLAGKRLSPDSDTLSATN